MITKDKFNFIGGDTTPEDRLKWIQSLQYSDFNPQVNNEKVFAVDLNTRTITVPTGQSELGVQGDVNAEVFWFAVPRHFEGQDLADPDKKWLVHVTAHGLDMLLPIRYVETEKVDEDLRFSGISFNSTVTTSSGSRKEATDGILLGWPISYDITEHPGNVNFALRCYEVGTSGDQKDKIIFSLGTKPATGKITASYPLNVEEIPDGTETVYPTRSIVLEMLDELLDRFGADGVANISYQDLGHAGMPQIGPTRLTPNTRVDFATINSTPISNTTQNFNLATTDDLNSVSSTVSSHATTLQSHATSLNNLNSELSATKQSLNSNVATLTSSINSNKSSIDTLISSVSNLTQKVSTNETDIDTLEASVKAIEDTIGGDGSEDTLTSRVDTLETDVETIQNELGIGEEGAGTGNSVLTRVETLETVLGLTDGEGEIPEGSLPELVNANAEAIAAIQADRPNIISSATTTAAGYTDAKLAEIKDGTSLDSFKDVEDALLEVGVTPEDRAAIVAESVSKAHENTEISSAIATINGVVNGETLNSFKAVEDALLEVGVSEEDRAAIISTAVSQAHTNLTLSAALEDMGKNSSDVSTLKTTVEDMNRRLIDAEDGDNKELRLTYDESVSILYLHTGDEIAADGSNVLGQTVVKGGGGGDGTTSSYELKLVVHDAKTDFTVLKGRPANISFTPTLTSEGESVGEAENITLYLYVNKTLKATFNQKSNKKNTLDVQPYLSSGFNNIQLTASYTEVIPDSGKTIVHNKPKYWSFDVIEMYIKSNFSDATVIEEAKTTFTYVPYGNLEKTIYFYLNGSEYAKVVTSDEDRSKSIEIRSPGHGVHSFEVWCTGVVEGETIESEHLHYAIMFAEAGNNTPLIRMKAENAKAQQYTTSTISYTVYKADSLNNEITFYVNDEDTGSKTVGRNEEKWYYKPMDFGTKVLTIGCGDYMSDPLTLEVTKFPYDISPVTANLEVDFNPVGRTNQDKDFNVFKNNAFDDEGNEKTITWELSDNFDWVNGGWQTDADGNGYFCVKAGTTATINYNMFADPYTVIGANSATGKGKEFKMIFKTTNVADVTTTFLECQAPPSAGTNNVGLEMKVHHGYVKSNNDTLEIPYAEEDIIEFDFNINPASLVNGSIDTTAEVIPMILSYEDGVPFLPKTYTSTATSFTQANPVPITIGSMDCDVHIYRMKCYSSYLSNEDVLNNFIADGKNADEMIERFTRNQIYDKGKLTPESLANARPDLKIIKISCPYFTNDKDNFVGDTSVQMIHRNGDPALDNWTFSNGYHSGQGTSSNKYGDAARNIDLLMCFDGVYKHKKILKLFEGREDEYWAIRSKFESADGTIKIEDGTGKVGLSRTSVPTSYFNIKVNVASSENTNNATLANRFDRFLPYTSVGKKRDPFVKNTMEFVNCVVFLQETDPDISKHREFQDTEWHYYAIGNIGDSKKTDQTRAYDPDDKKEFVVEIMDNNMPNAAFQTGFTDPENPLEIKYPITKAEWKEGNEAYDALYSDGWDGKKSFEMRYEHPKASDEQSEANIAKWNEFYEWVITTSHANFKSQLKNWVNLPAAYYYYLFTERYTMMDNRAKNSFWHWSKLYITQAEVTTATDELKAAQDALAELQGAETPDEEAIAAAQAVVTEKEAKKAWALRYTIDDEAAAINEGYRFDWWDYDNDTSLGIDNSGTLRMPYGKEDIDTELKEDGSINYYFNAGNSVFYRRLRENFVDELESAYNKAEESKCFDAQNLIDEFDERQSEFPEAIWNENFERLYARTYRAGTPDHLNKRYTGRKKYHRRQWERDQSAYMSSKYKTLMSRDLQILMRCKTPSGVVVPPKYDMNLIPYSDMYLNVQFGPNYIESIRAEAGKEYTIKSPFSDMTDNQVAVFNGQKIQSVGDISTFYPSEGTFGTAEKLKTLIIGNGTPGYANSYLTTLTTSVNNKLLEYLDIQNLTALKTVYLQIQNLKHFYAQGSGITDAVFANNGLLEDAYLPAAINTVIANNLYYLHTLEFEGYDALNKLVISNCPKVDELDIVQKSPNLTIVRLIDINWSGTRALDDATLLNRLLECSGIQEDGLTPLEQSVLTGYVHVNSIRQSEIDAFTKAWPELEIHWSEIIPQVDLTFYNEGANINIDEPVISFKVDLNDTLYPDKHDPTKNGLLTPAEFPTKPDSEDGQYSYVFKDWNPSLEPEITDTGDERYLTAKENMNFFATFEPIVKKYKVQWVDHKGVVGDEQEVEYGSPATTTYTPTRANQANAYYLFDGWNESTAKVTQDMIVEPVWISANPGAPSTTVSEELSAVEVYSLAQRVKDTNNIGDFTDYIGETDEITVQLGYMPDYDNVKSTVFESAMKTYTGLQRDVVNTGVKLFNPNQSFTIALDFTPDYIADPTKTTDIFMSCMATDFRGFRLSAATNTPTIQWCGSSAQSIYPMHTTTEGTKYREIIVLRYEKGSSKLRVYRNNRFSINPVDTLEIDVTNLWEVFDAPLVFGGHVNEAGQVTSASYARGTIHYAKLWEDDLGDSECKRICSWIWDEMKFERTNIQRYDRAEGGKVTASFVATELLENDFAFEANENDHSGWYDSQIRTWLNTKMLAALSPQWQQVLQSTKIYSLSGEKSTVGNLITGTSGDNYLRQHYSQTSTTDKLFIPGGTEVIPNLVGSSDPNYVLYESEQGPEAQQLTSYPQFSTATTRIKKYRFSDKAGFWPTRTPSLTNKSTFVYVDPLGEVNTTSYWYDKSGSGEWRNQYKNTPSGVLLAFSI